MQEEISLLELWQMLKRHLGKIIGLTVLFAALSAAWLSSGCKDIYERNIGQESVYKVIKYRKWTVAIKKDAQDSVRKMSADGARIPRQISRARLEKSYSLIQRPTFFIQQI